jgi:hypothetical protein
MDAGAVWLVPGSLAELFELDSQARREASKLSTRLIAERQASATQ